MRNDHLRATSSDLVFKLNDEGIASNRCTLVALQDEASLSFAINKQTLFWVFQFHQTRKRGTKP